MEGRWLFAIPVVVNLILLGGGVMAGRLTQNAALFWGLVILGIMVAGRIWGWQPLAVFSPILIIDSLIGVWIRGYDPGDPAMDPRLGRARTPREFWARGGRWPW